MEAEGLGIGVPPAARRGGISSPCMACPAAAPTGIKHELASAPASDQQPLEPVGKGMVASGRRKRKRKGELSLVEKATQEKRGMVAPRRATPEEASWMQSNQPSGPSNLDYVGQEMPAVSCLPGWENHFARGQAHGETPEQVHEYKAFVLSERVRLLRYRLHELANWVLVCDCKPGAPCHVDVLVEAFGDQEALQGPQGEDVGKRGIP